MMFEYGKSPMTTYRASCLWMAAECRMRDACGCLCELLR